MKLLGALKSTRFSYLWVGQTISSLGDGTFVVALSWQVLLLTGSGTALGVVMIAELISTVVFALLGGVVADRFRRRYVMVYSDAVRMLAVLTIAALSLFKVLQLWHLIVLAVVFGSAQSFFYPAYQAFVPQLVESTELPSANALTRLSKRTSGLLGPIVGAGCISLAGPGFAFALDGVTFVASIVSLLMMQQHDVRAEAPPERSGRVGTAGCGFRFPAISSILRFFWRSIEDVREGLRYILSWSWIWVSILVAAIINIGLEGTIDVALPKLVYSGYGANAWLLGALYASFAGGSIVASLIFGQIGRIRHRGVIAYSALLGSMVGLIGLGLPSRSSLGVPILMGAILVVGFGLGFFGLVWVTLLQEIVPEDKLGRVNSVDQLFSFGLTPIGYALVGVLIDHFNPSWAFIAAGVLGVVMIGIALSIRGIRKLD